MPRRQLLLQDPAAVAVQQPQSPRSGHAAAVSVPADTTSVVKSFIVSQPNRLRRGSVPKNARRAPFKGMHHRMRAEARRRHTARERAANAPEELVSFPPSPPQPPSPKVRRSPAHVPAPPAAAKKKGPQEAGAASSRSAQQPRPQPIAKLASRDYRAEDPTAAWQTVRGSRNVLRKKRRAGDEYDDDVELANALRSITGTIATHVASGGDWDRTCWVGGIPSNCATEAAVRAAFAAHGKVRSVIVREKQGDAKSWALVALGSAAAAANAQAQGAQVTDEAGQAVALKVKPADVSRELTKAESSGLMRKAMHAARAAHEGPAEAALREAEAVEGAGGEMLTPRSRAVESARTRAPSYRSMLMLRASLLNSLGRPGKAIEDLELLAVEDQANGASLRLLGKTQRAHALARNPPSATDQPGAMVPSAHSLREAAVRRPTDVQLSQELSAAIGDVQKERPFWMPASRRPALVCIQRCSLRVQTATDSAND